MELLDDYLKAIKPLLPSAQRDDIIKELSENLRSQMEDKEDELGRPLTEAEQESILNQHGHPLLVAGRYRQDSRHVSFGRQLIGPELFPFYAKSVWVILGITFVAFVAVMIVGLVGGKPLGQILKSAFGFPGIALPLFVQFVVLTLLFISIDFFQNRLPQGWHVPPTNLKPVSRRHSAIGVTVWSVLVLWWLLAPRFPFLIFGTAAEGLQLAPAWQTLYAPILVLLLAGLAQRIVNLLRPHWTWLFVASRMVINGIGAVIALYVLWTPPVHRFVVAQAAPDPAHFEHLAHLFNQAILWGVLSWLGFALSALAFVYALLCVEHLRRGVRTAGASRGLTAHSKEVGSP